MEKNVLATPTDPDRSSHEGVHRMLTHFAARRCLAAALAFVLSSGAPAAPAPEKPRSPGAAEQIRKGLDQRVSIEVANRTLEDAIKLLRDETKINLVLDRATLSQNGIEPAELAADNVKLRDVKARIAIRSVLAPFNLHYAIVGDTLLITTEEMAVYRQMKQRVSLDLDRVEFGSALKDLARDTGVNLILDPKLVKEAQAPVTLQADDISLESAARILAEMAGLKLVRVGDALFVTGKANAADLRGEPEIGGMSRPVARFTDGPTLPGIAVPAAPAPPPLVFPPPPPPKP
jgi:hypothetical protein